ncbi:hypothetical protein V8F20_002664 [Naviculisporaceae sp. PSN 640]
MVHRLRRRPSWLRLFRHPQKRPRCLPHPRTLFCFAVFSILSCWLILPYDNTIRQATRWTLQNIQSIFLPLRSSEKWVFANPPTYPVSLTTDTLVIVKTGYGTRHRLNPWFEALSIGNNNTAASLHDFLIIADFATNPKTHIQFQNQTLPVYDVVSETIFNREVLLHHESSHPRFKKYRQLQGAISSGDSDLAMKLSKSMGWELDALKFLSGLELAYQKFPSKKWYILADDDTYLVRTSLLPLLSNLDSSEAHYIGNAVGDFKTRFAHGGSSVILSQGAMRKLIVENPRKLALSQVESLDEVWGDRLLARALVRVGVFLEEKYSRLFNGEGPRYSRVKADRLCSPVVAFHGLAKEEDMLQVGRWFGNSTGVVLWGDLWDIVSQEGQDGWEGVEWSWREQAKEEGSAVLTDGAGDGESDFSTSSTSHTEAKEKNLKMEGKNGVHKNWDHVVRFDENVVVVEGVPSPEDCAMKCRGSNSRFMRSKCLAWTWEADKALGGKKKIRAGKCYLAPWMVFGQNSMGRSSGVNQVRLRELEESCLRG